VHLVFVTSRNEFMTDGSFVICDLCRNERTKRISRKEDVDC
jgi:hypothetical protein